MPIQPLGNEVDMDMFIVIVSLIVGLAIAIGATL